MKINWIFPEVSQCGGVRVALQYANALAERGHDVVCYAPQSGQHFGRKRIFFLKEVLRMRHSSELRGEWFDNRFTYSFPMWISNDSVRDADVTIATSWITAYWTRELSENKGKKCYIVQDFETWGDEKYNRRVLETYNFQYDQVISVSTALHDRLLRETGMQSVVVCNGVEECFLRETNKSTDQITIGIPFRENRGNDVKNCAMGIRVLLRIKEQHPGIKLAAFGFRRPSEWNDDIDFLENPTRNELVDFYNRINILYVPSVYEGWGLPAMEAMAQENAVIAGNSGVIQEIGVDGKNCLILENPRDEQEAFNKIEGLIRDQRHIVEIGARARSTVSKMTNADSADKFERILLDII